jgi:hypothetical protein
MEAGFRAEADFEMQLVSSTQLCCYSFLHDSKVLPGKS